MRVCAVTFTMARQLAYRWGCGSAGIGSVTLLCCAGALASVGLQGFYFAVGNNSYHIAIVENWMADPQFARDEYVQSLRYHTSYVWPVVRQLIGILDLYHAFLLAHICNRIAMFTGIALLAREFGLQTRSSLAIAISAVVTTRYLLAASAPGEHDLFMAFLNHSSLTWPFIFASWLLVLRKQPVLALALQGPVFAINAFVAICGGPAILAGLYSIWRHDRRLRLAFGGRCLAGVAAALIIAGPTITWIARSMTDQLAPAPFSFSGFLHSYYLNHWFLSATSARRLASFGLVCVGGAACLVMAGDRVRGLLAVWLAYAAVFVAGACLPLLADSRLLFDLHPMRVGAGCLVMLSVIAIVLHVTSVLVLGRPIDRLLAGLALVSFVVGQDALLLMFVCILGLAARVNTASMLARWGRPLATLIDRVATKVHLPDRTATIAVVTTCILTVAGLRITHDPGEFDRSTLEAAKAAGLWLRQFTPPGSMILIPSGTVPGADDPVSVWARRPIWYDWKEGAAVMWTPHYFAEWSKRREEVLGLKTVRSVTTYACTKGIAYVVETPDRLSSGEMLSQNAAVYRNEKFVVFEMAPICAGVPKTDSLPG